MAAQFDKVYVKIRRRSIPLDKRFLEALSLVFFDTLYDDSKQKTNALLRELIGPGEKIHPQDAHYIILKNLIPKNKAALLLT